MVSPLRPKRCAERFLGPEKRHGGPRVTQVALAARQPDRSCEPVPVYPETRRRSENIHTGSVARPCFGTSSSATPERAQAGGPLLCRQTMPTTASVPERSGAGSLVEPVEKRRLSLPTAPHRDRPFARSEQDWGRRLTLLLPAPSVSSIRRSSFARRLGPRWSRSAR